ncbi:hypothetical protein SAMN05444389_102256 [Paracoccus solventivorans]|uniref:Uncharacterized protein n=1 Tax=Paracoccus solventivorans TaxID=53463 RepID=A0A1M7EQ98_9RHOB|nr:hypothetical protein SAMN05444389_102256 [Paracoccus solventivorans]
MPRLVGYRSCSQLPGARHDARSGRHDCCPAAAGATRLAHLPLLAGEALADDLRAEIDLLRAEMDLLKRELRRLATG